MTTPEITYIENFQSKNKTAERLFYFYALF